MHRLQTLKQPMSHTVKGVFTGLGDPMAVGESPVPKTAAPLLSSSPQALLRALLGMCCKGPERLGHHSQGHLQSLVSCSIYKLAGTGRDVIW